MSDLGYSVLWLVLWAISIPVGYFIALFLGGFGGGLLGAVGKKDESVLGGGLGILAGWIVGLLWGAFGLFHVIIQIISVVQAAVSG